MIYSGKMDFRSGSEEIGIGGKHTFPLKKLT